MHSGISVYMPCTQDLTQRASQKTSFKTSNTCYLPCI